MCISGHLHTDIKCKVRVSERRKREREREKKKEIRFKLLTLSDIYHSIQDLYIQLSLTIVYHSAEHWEAHFLVGL